LLNRPGCDFSFSGLKTAVRQAAEALPPGDWNPQDIYDICASFQAAVAECMAKKSARAMKDFSQRHGKQHADGTPYGFVVAGGVAANTTLRQHLQQAAATHGMAFVAPPLHLCTDNGAMIAWAGLEHLAAGHRSPLDFKPRPRWPLDPNGAKRPGAGIKA
jgi:N6-L-threonylcarbamoyladenine synthase